MIVHVWRQDTFGVLKCITYECVVVFWGIKEGFLVYTVHTVKKNLFNTNRIKLF